MKHLFTVIFLWVTIISLNAQEKYGILTYQLPAGFSMTKQDASIILSSSLKEYANCKIIIYQTENVTVNQVLTYLKMRKSHTEQGVIYSDDVKGVTRTEANRIISFSSHSKGDPSKTEQHHYFYSFTNNSSSIYITLSCDSIDSCKDVFNKFLQSLLIDLPNNQYKDQNNAASDKTKRKKAAPCAPAAPAPVM